MNLDLLLANFDRLIDSPEAIPKLRELILDLAVRGKLVPQDSQRWSGPLIPRAVRKGIDKGVGI